MALFLIHRFGGSLLPWLFVGLAWALGVIQELRTGSAAVDRFGSGLGSALLAGVITLIFALMILVAVGVFDRVDWRWLTTLGALTYPLYLFHHHVGFLLIGWLHEPLGHRLALPATVVIALGVAFAVHRLVEKPLQRPLKAALDRSISADGHLARAGGSDRDATPRLAAEPAGS
jgi:peptidoglycan/LPS O-acetylase OafA/YrhL